MKHMRIFSALLAAAVLAGSLTACGGASGSAASSAGESAFSAASQPVQAVEEVAVLLSDDGVTVDGTAAGTDSGAAVYLSNDIIYYEDKETYESGNPYGEGSEDERHTAEEAAAHTVVNITEAGAYRLSGTLSQGQIRVDLGEDAETDPNAVVTLILDGVDVNCTVAPAILFLNVYECDNGWTTDTATSEVDTSAAGANIVLADGSVNTVEGSHVARIYKDNTEEKKLWKQDGAVYSYMSMNVNGSVADTGRLDITADNEGLNSELHLTINGGNINIYAGNDGINTNEDGVSVTTINGGSLHIIAGLGEEGDGIDSNGWLVINGGTVVASANPAADAGLDSDMGSYVNGGTVVALGSTMDWAESDSEQVTMNLQFADYKASDSAIVVTREDGTAVFAYDPSEDEVLGSNTRRYMGAVVSCPEFAVGETYQVYIGGEVTGTDVGGVYDVATIAAYEGGVQQAYTGTDVGRGGFGGMGGGQRPEMPEGEMPEMPEGEVPEGGFGGGMRGERPELPEGEMPQMPEGGFELPEGGMGGGRGQRPEMTEGEMPEGGFEVPEGEVPELTEGGFEMPEGGMMATGEPVSSFYMQDKVNAFSGVADL